MQIVNGTTKARIFNAHPTQDTENLHCKVFVITFKNMLFAYFLQNFKKKHKLLEFLETL